MNRTHCATSLHSNLMPCPGNRSGDTCPVERCDYARKILESIHLIRLGARVGLAGQLTGLEKKTLKRLYRELMGRPSPSGQLPYSDTWLLENDRYQFHANLIWYLHRRLNRPECSPARILIDVFEVYIQMAREPRLDLTRTAFVIQLFTTGLWNKHRCSLCQTAFPAPVDSNQTRCPGCRLYFRHRCQHCGTALSPKSRGVRRKRCPQCGVGLI
ncbi:MAG: hypothetical protein GY792_22610 [Gammaproteobacteria bacterium]|nr:hypothetical protein [Gammaproteobacteria bacterium]